MAPLVEYVFEWDPQKAAENLQKHGIAFRNTQPIFADPGALTLFDVGHSQKEERWITMGLDALGNLAVACHTFEPSGPNKVTIRLISVRKANSAEARQYRREKR